MLFYIYAISIPFLIIALTSTYFYANSNLRKTITILIFILSIFVGVMGATVIQSLASTHIEILTKVSANTFAPYLNFMTFYISALLWITLITIFMIICFAGMFIRIFLLSRHLNSYKGNSKFYKNLSLILFISLLTLFIRPIAMKIFKPESYMYIQKNYFVESMYHPYNEDEKDEKLICENINIGADTRIALLPNGNVSVAIRKEKEEKGPWSFKVAKCQRPEEDIYKSSED